MKIKHPNTNKEISIITPKPNQNKPLLSEFPHEILKEIFIKAEKDYNLIPTKIKAEKDFLFDKENIYFTTIEFQDIKTQQKKTLPIYNNGILTKINGNIIDDTIEMNLKNKTLNGIIKSNGRKIPVIQNHTIEQISKRTIVDTTMIDYDSPQLTGVISFLGQSNDLPIFKGEILYEYDYRTFSTILSIQNINNKPYMILHKQISLGDYKLSNTILDEKIASIKGYFDKKERFTGNIIPFKNPIATQAYIRSDKKYIETSHVDSVIPIIKNNMIKDIKGIPVRKMTTLGRINNLPYIYNNERYLPLIINNKYSGPSHYENYLLNNHPILWDRKENYIIKTIKGKKITGIRDIIQNEQNIGVITENDEHDLKAYQTEYTINYLFNQKLLYTQEGIGRNTYIINQNQQDNIYLIVSSRDDNNLMFFNEEKLKLPEKDYYGSNILGDRIYLKNPTETLKI